MHNRRTTARPTYNDGGDTKPVFSGIEKISYTPAWRITEFWEKTLNVFASLLKFETYLKSIVWHCLYKSLYIACVRIEWNEVFLKLQPSFIFEFLKIRLFKSWRQKWLLRSTCFVFIQISSDMLCFRTKDK